MKWYENHRHNWSYCHDLRFWISFYFLCGWEAVEYGEIPPFCVYAICPTPKPNRPKERNWVLQGPGPPLGESWLEVLLFRGLGSVHLLRKIEWG